MDLDTIKFFASMGVGGVLAGGIFWMYRKDSLVWSEAWKGQSQMLLTVVKENTAAVTALIENLRSITKETK
jgi:hypothetical protein